MYEPRRWLWLTLAVTDPPTNGQFLYSKGLIEAARLAGLSLDILALERLGGHCEGRIGTGPRWWIAPDEPRSRWSSIVSPLPHIANRTNTRAMRRLLVKRLLRQDRVWDAVVFDSLAVGWALPAILRHGRPPSRPLLIYAAHNHETSLARRLAAVHPHLLKRQISRLDALKVARLERRLLWGVDVVTADAPEDCKLFRAQCPDKRIEWLPPIFLDAPVVTRRIDERVPRRAVMLGTFDWLPKRINLVEFLRAADPLFAAAGIELQVVGAADPAFLHDLRGTVRATTFTGPVGDVRPYLAKARIGIAAERVGGGFKLKTLDYVFHRVPLAALTGTTPGLPVRDGVSAIIDADAPTLARRIVEAIDDFDRLNRLQSQAYAACVDVFAAASVARLLQSFDATTARQPHPIFELDRPVVVD